MRKVEGPVKHALLSKGKDARGSFDVERITQFGQCTEKKEARMALCLMAKWSRFNILHASNDPCFLQKNVC
jgi:hypothetical protein